MHEALNKIHHGDCIAGMNALPAGVADLVFADPPFNIGYDYASRTFHAINDTDEALDGLVARVRVLDLESNVVFDESQDVALAGGISGHTPRGNTHGGAP